MDVRNCRSCGRLINYTGGQPICAACQKKLEDKFNEVKKFLDENPRASINQVSEEMDVSTKQIKQWIREERLTLSDPGAGGINCEQCGAPITTGRFCSKCKASMMNRFADAIDKPKIVMKAPEAQHDKNRMRFLQS